MREKKILMLIIAILLLVSNITVLAGGTYHEGNDTTIGTEFDGDIDDYVEPDELRYRKDEDRPGDKTTTLPLGNGYSIDLVYDECEYSVTWSLNEPSDPDFEIRIDRINVKASNGYMSYPEGLDGDSHELWSVPNDKCDDIVTETSLGVECIDCPNGHEEDCGCEFHQISHVTVVYEFTEVERFGTIKVCKDVTNVERDPTAFEFIIEGDAFTITGSVIESKCVTFLEIPFGTYEYSEIVPEGYIGIVTSGSIKIGEGSLLGEINFENEKYMPPGPGKLIVKKYVHGDLSDPYDEFMIRVKNLQGETVTGGAVSETQSLSFKLPEGEYIVEETGYGEYTPRYLTVAAIVESETTTTVAFHNCWNSTPPGPGKLIVEKYVYGDLSDPYDEFMIRVKNLQGETVTGGAVSEMQSLSFKLPEGEYVVEETGYGEYSPRYLTVAAIVESEATTTVAFHNSWNSIPPGPGTLIIDKHVSGDLADERDVFEFAVTYTNGITIMHDEVSIPAPIYVTASGITDGSIQLKPGEYTVIETYYDGYIPEYTTTMATITSGQETKVHFYNSKNSDPPEYGWLCIKKDVYGNRSDEDDMFTIEIRQGDELITEVAISENQGADIMLEVGDYTLVETDYSPYDPDFTTTEVSIEAYDEYLDNYTEVEFRNEYQRKSDSKRYRMKITKEADADEYEVGDIITYTITVENTGNQTLTDIEVTDPMLGFEEIIERLHYSNNDTVEFTVEYEATEEGVIDNTAYAKDDRAPDVEDDETVVVKGEPPRDKPGLSIKKDITGEKKANFFPGETVEFTLIVKNTGDTTLNNILVIDAMAGYEYTIPTLASKESMPLEVSMVIGVDQDDFDNIATAEVDDLFAQDFAPVTIVEIIEEEETVPLDLPQAGVSPMFLFYGLAALASGLGLAISKKR